MLFFFSAPATTVISTLSLHDALPISQNSWKGFFLLPASTVAPAAAAAAARTGTPERSEEHTSELQSRFDLVCRLLLEKKKISSRCVWPPCRAASPRPAPPHA